MSQSSAETHEGLGIALQARATTAAQEAELFARVLNCAIGAELFPYHRLTAERTG